MELAASTSLRFSPLPQALSRSRSLSSSIPCKSSIPRNSANTPREDPEEEAKKHCSRLVQVSATLTVIAASLSPAPADARVAEKKSRAKRQAEALSPEEIGQWSRGLPTVGVRIPYTEILNFKEEGKLLHVVKPPSVSLRQWPEAVLVVLDDSRVLRTVLPTAERDERFWESWDRLKLDSFCVNAYTPPVRKPELPTSYLGWLAKVPDYFRSTAKPKPKSKRSLELENARKELAEKRRGELARVRQEREAMGKAVKAHKKAEERRRRLEIKKAKYVESLRQARENYQQMAYMWATMARDKNVVTAAGFFIFFIFYRTVVLNYRKQQQDYEDRLKIEKAEAEERKKMRELEREMAGLEGPGEDENDEKGGEQNPYMKMAMQFMRSGARVRRAHSKLPQYMEKGIDIKFSDVAGLGKIKLELEEIVKFFTLGEVYRRRGVKIPGKWPHTLFRLFFILLLILDVILSLVTSLTM